MLDIEKIQRRFPSVSVNDILQQYERDIGKPKDIAQRAPYFPPPNEDLFKTGKTLMSTSKKESLAK